VRKAGFLHLSDPFHATNSLERTADYLSTRLLDPFCDLTSAQQQFATAGILKEERDEGGKERENGK